MAISILHLSCFETPLHPCNGVIVFEDLINLILHKPAQVNITSFNLKAYYLGVEKGLTG